jgi:methyl-accepting chemotaxis protein
MSEIVAASDEQAAGIGQVNNAMTQMDTFTQQNAALVEEAAAAAKSMEQQAAHLSQVVGVFRLSASEAAHGASRAEPHLAPVLRLEAGHADGTRPARRDPSRKVA